MSALNNSLLLGQEGGGGYAISRSLRFNSSDSAYLSRTPASAGNRKTWTWAGWVKRSGLGVNSGLFETSGSPRDDANSLSLFFADGNFGTEKDALTIARHSFYNLITTQVFRDPAAWYHIVLVADTVQATASNRLKLYVNGSQITSFTSATYPSLNEDLPINASVSHSIGRHAASAYLNGYLADIHFIDGQALTPTSFGEFSATTGVWMPKAYTGTYGTNGFKLNFSDNSTAAALGTDSSGLGNSWSVNNISVTAGAGNDSLVDVPTNGSEVDTGVGGQVRGNYATFNPLAGAGTFSNGNLQLQTFGVGESSGISSIGLPVSGKWYWEVTMDDIGSDPYTGITDGTVLNSLGNAYVAYRASGAFRSAPTATDPPSAASYTTGDIIGLAFDADSLSLAFYKNGSLQGTATSISSRQYFTLCYCYQTAQRTINFGQRPFAYTAPSGFKALCTANLPAPTIVNPSTVMDVKLYTGNGSTQTISGLGFSPDLVWIKARNAVNTVNRPHQLFDTVREAPKALSSNRTDAEDASGGYDNDGALTAFTTDGFTVESGPAVGNSSSPYVAWAWDAGSSTVTNTSGSITSSVRANATAGFSIVTYTAGATNATVGHGLGVAPELILCKSRSNTITWVVYHKSLGKDAYLFLNGTDAAGTGSTNYWGTAGPNSTTFGLASSTFANNSGNMVAYCFAPVAGYASISSFVGNGSSDGVFVYTGFRPRFLLMKSATSATNWFVHDTARSGYNAARELLFPNLSNAEDASNTYVDFLSNGFKLRFTNTDYNTSGQTYIYYAVAESPFQYARAR